MVRRQLLYDNSGEEDYDDEGNDPTNKTVNDTSTHSSYCSTVQVGANNDVSTPIFKKPVIVLVAVTKRPWTKHNKVTSAEAFYADHGKY